MTLWRRYVFMAYLWPLYAAMLILGNCMNVSKIMKVQTRTRYGSAVPLEQHSAKRLMASVMDDCTARCIWVSVYPRLSSAKLMSTSLIDCSSNNRAERCSGNTAQGLTVLWLFSVRILVIGYMDRVVMNNNMLKMRGIQKEVVVACFKITPRSIVFHDMMRVAQLTKNPSLLRI
jgi:hypothetical protein